MVLGIPFYISSRALALVKAGKAVISSGGVRLLDGRFVELFKPLASQMLNPTSPWAIQPFRMFEALSPINTAMNVANVGFS